jgi:NAD(P) transhydrogenase subunit alpha
MKIVVPKESRPGERRVALTPDSAKRFIALGCAVAVEAGAGDGALFPDDDYRAAGAEVVDDISAAIADADVVLRVRRPGSEDAAAMKQGAVLVGMLEPTDDLAQVQSYADQGIVAFSLEFLPRITRAQSMDVLSSQSNLAGYKAVLDATDVFARAMPMMMTAAGTIAPAKVMVLGAGVAGLQAIATARRLGAVVSATDVRPAAKEQVESLGASFVMVEDEETAQAETAGGYAKEMSESYQRKQAELVRATLAKQDIAICTALIPGRPAPRLISANMVKEMRPGSVIVDLAVESGGNCELSRAGEVVEAHGVKIVGHRNWPSRLATDASALYARNVLNFLAPLIDADSGAIKIDWEDEIITATALTRDGAVIHPACKADA